MGLRVIAALALTACGRLGFDGASPATPDPDAPVDAPDPRDPPALLACNTPQRFPLGTMSTVVATPLHDGFALFTVDGAAHLAGWRYRVDASGFAATAENVSLADGVTDTVGAAVVGSDVLVAAVTGAPTPTGTIVIPLDGALAPRGPTVTHAEIAGTTPLAGGAAFALVTLEGVATQAVARQLTSLGAYATAPVPIAAATEIPRTAGIAPVEGGYIAWWIANRASPNEVAVARVGPAFEPLHGPVSANPTPFDPTLPRVAWAPLSNVYLVTWYDKNATNDDDTWIQLRDATLAPITPPMLISTTSYHPDVASDGTDFWLTWNNYSIGALETVRVSATGTVSVPAKVVGTGGTPAQWLMVQRAGQPVLVWTEQGGTGPNLYFTALCP